MPSSGFQGAERQSQNPELGHNSEDFHIYVIKVLKTLQIERTEITYYSYEISLNR